ncbi:MAG: phenylalanine--tRNA ligase subunit beta [Candidatus Omnitrophica bacterium]|nr:phenylalanine--tRNA ligase subunit beta [Candidatus Omnitrophota bacterium]
MKITYSWIKELLDIKVSPQALADKLSMAGLSVELLEKSGDDWVYHIEVTSNRPDWLSVNGIVREIAAITGAELRNSAYGKGQRAKGKKILCSKPHALCKLSISIEDSKDCAFYYGNVIAGVKVGPSPQWLAKRLEALGLRSVNNVVDITNYCLMETGQPLHAFDLDKIVSQLAGEPVNQLKIIVRRAKKDEKIMTIDGVERILNENILVIAGVYDKTGQPANRQTGKPIAVAGIMGGAGTEVSGKTTNILLESAYFDPVVVRRGSRILGVASDSSYRFERGVDVSTVRRAIDRATEMTKEIAGGAFVCAEQAGKAPAQAPRKIHFCLSEALDTLGMEMTASQAKNIFEKLGFSVGYRGGKDSFLVSVPTTRRDIKIQEDLSEELVRVWGYDKIPLTAPAIKPFALDVPPVGTLEARAKGLLVNMGLKEVITYSLTGDEDYKKTAMELGANLLELENPLTRDLRILRPTLIPSLLNCVSFNVNHNNKDLEFFEIARVFGAEGTSKGPETLSLGIVLCGEKRSTWQKESKRYTLFDIRGMIEALLEEAKVKNYEIKKTESMPFAQKNTGCEIIAGKDTLAVFCMVNNDVKRAWGIKGKEDVYVAEVSLELLAHRADLKKSFSRIVSIPSIIRDVSVLAGQDAPYSRIKALIESKADGLIRSVSLADIYQGQEVPAGQLGLTITIEYGCASKTLTDEEVNSVHQKVLGSLTGELSLKIR